MADKDPKTNKAEEEQEDWDDWDEEEDEDTESGGRMGFLDHLTELRSRIFKMFIALLVGIIICWNFVDPLWKILEGPARTMLETSQEQSFELTKKAQSLTIRLPRLPELPEELADEETAKRWRTYLNGWLRDANKDLEGQLKELLVSRDSKLMQTSITEAFFLKVKIAFMAGLILMFPFLAYQIWRFVAPGLYKEEKKMALPFILFSTIFFLGGVSFGYFVAVPFAGKFLMAYGSEFVQMITVNKYMDFLLSMMLGLGVVFEIPMAIFIMAKIGIATPKFLIDNFRYAVLVIVIVAAIITPTGDPINLSIFSVPMILLYGIGIIIAFIWGPKDKNEDDDDDDDWDDDEDDEDDEDESAFPYANRAYSDTDYDEDDEDDDDYDPDDEWDDDADDIEVMTGYDHLKAYGLDEKDIELESEPQESDSSDNEEKQEEEEPDQEKKDSSDKDE